MILDTGTSSFAQLGRYPKITSLGDQRSIVISDANISFSGQIDNLSSFQPRRPVAPVADQSKLDHFVSIPHAIHENWTALALSDISAKKYDVIYKLAAHKDGWRGPGSRGLRGDCLRSFLSFWQQVKTVATAPHLTLSPNGNLIAQWFKNTKRNLVVEFMTGDRVYIGLQEGSTEYDAVDEATGAINFLTHRTSRPLRWK